MMSRAVLLSILAIMPALGLGAEDPKSPPTSQAQQPPTQLTAAPGSSTVPPVIPPGNATDPAKLAEPAPSPDKIPSVVPIDAKTYVVGPEDDLSVSVWEQPQLSCAPCRVRSDGMLTVPLINEIKAAGITLLELRQAITEALSAKALVDPQVTVSLLAAHSKKYYMTGQVRTPGEKELIMPTTVFQAIVSAGGFMDFANQKNITIARGDKRFKFNFKDAVAGKNPKQNIYLESGDMIIVK
jgi:polysaccharide export outer membrane protein